MPPVAVHERATADEDGNVAVLRVVAAVLGDLPLLAGVDGAVLSDAQTSGTRASPAATPKTAAASVPA